jgi:predicted lipid-binding transport protein (Tim44 family)
MAPDLIVYALVAAGLVLWLRSILGTRHGDERERPNPFATQPEAVQGKQPFVKGDKPVLTSQDRIIQLAANPTKVLSVENKTAENGLLEIARADKKFNINFFLDGAQEVFVMVVEAFAKGDRDALKDFLAPGVYKAFEGVLAQRESRGETMSAEILAVRKAEIIEARMEGRNASITLRFNADEISVTKDANGVIVSGHGERVVPMRDIWTFMRDTRSNDPRWLVSETRGDFDGDNDILPNTN